jgi:hypothetical protein
LYDESYLESFYFLFSQSTRISWFHGTHKTIDSKILIHWGVISYLTVVFDVKYLQFGMLKFFKNSKGNKKLKMYKKIQDNIA